MSTSLSLANFGSVVRAVLKSLIQAFWFVAVAVADRMAISPSQFGARSQAHVAIDAADQAEVGLVHEDVIGAFGRAGVVADDLDAGRLGGLERGAIASASVAETTMAS